MPPNFVTVVIEYQPFILWIDHIALNPSIVNRSQTNLHLSLSLSLLLRKPHLKISQTMPYLHRHRFNSDDPSSLSSTANQPFSPLRRAWYRVGLSVIQIPEVTNDDCKDFFRSKTLFFSFDFSPQKFYQFFLRISLPFYFLFFMSGFHIVLKFSVQVSLAPSVFGSLWYPKP